MSMGVYIKDMEKPKSCHKCFIKQGSCPAIRKRIQVLPANSDIWVPYNYRHDDCPLWGVSTPHGDLIDRDALKENGELVNEDMGLYNYQGISMDSINFARVIIEAEGLI